MKAVLVYSRLVAVLAGCAIVSIFITYILYNYTQALLKERLQDRLVAIVSTAATHFNADDVVRVQSTDDVGTAEYARVVTTLKAMRDANEDIQYAYLMRKTEDPDTLSFVADAEGLIPPDEWDFNGDGVIGDDEAVPMPGDLYEVAEYPILRDEAFYYPVAAKDLEEDQWSVQLSAYAPIIDHNNTTVAVIGIDVEVTDFKQKTQTTLLPFLLFILLLLLILTLLTLVVSRYQSERAEMMREINRQKDELLSIVSHQLATPISSLKWYLEMLYDGDSGPLTKDQRKDVQIMQGAAASLADLVSMILDVSRIQLGRMQMERAPLDLNTFFENIISEMEPKVKQQKIKFVVDRPEHLPKTAMLDARLMRMTLENLLSNAIKYTPEGGKVHLKVTYDHHQLIYSVSDTGCGIPKDEQDKIFGKLFRARNVRNSVDGNGFGLYVAKGAVERQDGTIVFKSQEGKGTTFTVEIPIQIEKLAR